MVRKVYIILGIIGIIIVAFIGIKEYIENKMDELPDAADSFYNNNKVILKECVELCFENDIDYIADKKHDNKAINKIYTINGYFVYADNDIDDEIKSELSDIIEVLRDNNITKVYIDIEDHQYVSFIMMYFFAGAGIEYWAEPKPIDDIKHENYSDNAWYVDENWVIIEYD
jgi:hypothetical protein